MLKYPHYLSKFTADQMETYVLAFIEHCDERKRKKALKIVHARMMGTSRFLHPSRRKVLKLNTLYL